MVRNANEMRTGQEGRKVKEKYKILKSVSKGQKIEAVTVRSGNGMVTGMKVQ